MTKFVAQEGGQGVPVGIYQNAIFDGIEVVPANIEKGYKPGYRFKFKVAEGPHAGAIASRVVGGDAPKRVNGRWNNLAKILSEMTGQPLALGVDYDIEPLVGKAFTVVVKQGEGGGTRVDAVMRVA